MTFPSHPTEVTSLSQPSLKLALNAEVSNEVGSLGS